MVGFPLRCPPFVLCEFFDRYKSAANILVAT